MAMKPQFQFGYIYKLSGKAALVGALSMAAFSGYGQTNSISSSGNVGIGTTSPTAILHVNPALDATSAIKIGTPYTSGNINVPIKGSPGGYNIDFYTWRDVQADQIGARIRAERINDYAPNSALVQAMDLTFATSLGYTGSLSEKMRINSTGNVGIGTAFPAEKLSVNGKIRAHEIKVEITGWSDFVFAKDYKLPTLQETEKHIKEKGHLPGIPSAEEVEKNGVELGDMNKKLLQKIEELTLYLIEKDKKIRVIEERLDKIDKANLANNNILK